MLVFTVRNSAPKSISARLSRTYRTPVVTMMTSVGSTHLALRASGQA